MFENVYFTVYQITNLINGKIYVGKHITDDLNDEYFGSGKLLIKALEKYGLENFKKEYLAVFNNLKDMNNYERQIVNKNFVNRNDTYNLKEGGDGGWDYVNEEIRINGSLLNKEIAQLGRKAANKKSAHIKGNEKHKELLKNNAEYYFYFRKRIKEGIEKNGPCFKNKKHNEETKQRIGQYNSEYQKGSSNSQYGTCWIYSLEEKQNKKIPKDDLQYWLDLGWNKGRKMNLN